MSNADDTHRHVEEETPVSHLGFDNSGPLLPAEIARELNPHEQAGFFFTLVDAAADAIIAHRPDGSVVYVNSAAAKLLGYSCPAEMLALPPYGWIDPEQFQAMPRRLESILTDGILSFESRALHKDGSLSPTEVIVRRVDTPLGPMMIAVMRDISARVKNRETLEHLAYHDALTDLSNRIHLEDRLSIAIADARRYGDGLAMAYIDLDHFKPVNDRYGHATGDDALVEVARRLRESVRGQDTVARLGGDEFVVVFPRLTSPDEPVLICQRLVEKIREPIVIGDVTIGISASVGIALYDMREDDERSLLVKADTAMYQAKCDPDRPCRVWEPGMKRPDDTAEENPYL